MGDKITDLQYSYIEDILMEIDGIGKSTAARIISTKNSFRELQRIVDDDISDIRGITNKKSDKIVGKINDIDFDKTIEALYTEKILKNFLDSQYKKVENVKLDDLDINVLLIKALGFTTVEETIEFYIYQRITRSAVTSWGQGALEDICLISGAEEVPRSENVDVGGKRFDMKREKGDKTYYIQLKSGPNTMNIGMVDSLNKMIKKIEQQNPNSVGMLGMTYGDRSQVSSQITGNLNNFDEKSAIGSEFWEFLTEQEDYFSELISIISGLSEEYEDRYANDYLDLVEKKKQELINQWKQQYGTDTDGTLDDFIQEYTTE
jgi:ribosomal protein S13